MGIFLRSIRENLMGLDNDLNPGIINTKYEPDMELDGVSPSSKAAILRMTVKGSNDIAISYDDDTAEDADDSPYKTTVANNWMKDSGLSIIVPVPTPQELKVSWEKWLSMPRDHQILSDDKSLELYGITNQEHYEELLARMIDHKNDIQSEDVPHSDSIRISVNNENTLDNMLNILKYNNHSIDKKIIGIEESKNMNDRFKPINGFPYYTPTELIRMGYYSENEILMETNTKPLNETYKYSDWISNYVIKANGIMTENDSSITQAWLERVGTLLREYKNNKSEETKQSILELGWNPNVELNIENLKKSKQRVTSMIDLGESNIIDLSEFTSSLSDNDVHSLNEESAKTRSTALMPIYLVLVYTGSIVGKSINFFTNGKYSHAGLSLNLDMDTIYSYNLKMAKGGTGKGFSIESAKRYADENEESTMAVYPIFLPRVVYKKVVDNMNKIRDNYKNTNYNILGFISILINKPIFKKDNDMVCSQFVDTILKMGNVSLSDKDSVLVTPQDLYNGSNAKNIFKLYEGTVAGYIKDIPRFRKVMKSIDRKKYLIEETSIVNESAMIDALIENIKDINKLFYLENSYHSLSFENKEIFDKYIRPRMEFKCIYEVKEFPVQFDKEGNVLIKKIKTINYDAEFTKIHKILKVYEKNKNYEGMKYEISALWFMNLTIQEKLYDTKKPLSKQERTKLNNSRARILNDFTKYLNMITAADKKFNFTEYYNDTPFSDAVIRVNKSTLKYGGETIKNALKLFL